MSKRFGWPGAAGIFHNEAPKSPWGSGGGKGDGGGSGGGPRNPWSFPPDGRRPRGGGGGAGGPFDELFRRARGGGFPGAPTGPRLWIGIILGLVVLWLLYTMIHFVGPQERAVVTQLGRYYGTLEPGVQLTPPAPIATVQTIDVQAIRDENFPEAGGENLMITGDQNIVDLAYLVQWRVADAADYVYQIAKPRDTVRATAETAMRAVVANASLNDTITSGRAKIEGEVQAMMQRILDEYHSGIIIQSVSIQKAAAPQAVDEAFKQVTAAQQEAQGNRNNARGYAQQVLANAQGEAAEFDKIYEQYKLAPEVTRRRLYYETMEAVLAKSNKTIIEAPGVTPYLPLPGMKAKADAAPDAKPEGAAR